MARRLTEAVAKEHVGADETELLALLESKAVDYAFLYRSTAEDHHLKAVALPPELNLGRPELDARYAEASVALKSGAVQGHAITYGITIPTAAAHPVEAELFLAFLVGPQGRRIQQTAGFRPLEHPRAHGAGKLPESLGAVGAR